MTDSKQSTASYGQRDATFQAAGGEAGIRKLVDAFYDLMSSQTKYQKIYHWHPDGDIARDKLARFLCGWMGGPNRYNGKYGAISIPRAHARLPVTSVERDMWLSCMAEALGEQEYPDELKTYLIEHLGVPAEAVRRTCEKASVFPIAGQ